MAHTNTDHALIARARAISTLNITPSRAVAALARAARVVGNGFAESRAIDGAYITLTYGDRPFAPGVMPGWVGA